MSLGTLLIVAGTLIFLAGVAKLGGNQSGGFSLKNFGINFGGSVTQTNKIGNITPEAGKEHKTDWGGIAIAALGALTALVGFLK